MADNEMPVEAPKMTRQERLNAQRDAFLEWAKTATTDEIPGDLGVEATPPAS